MTYKGWYAIKPKQPTNQPQVFNTSNNVTVDIAWDMVNKHFYSFLYDFYSSTAQSAESVKYANSISSEGYWHPLPIRVLDMTLNHLMGEVSLLELWGMYSTPLLRLLPGALFTGVFVLWRGIKIFIPRREFIFHTCEDGAAWHLIPHRISSS